MVLLIAYGALPQAQVSDHRIRADVDENVVDSG